MVYHGKVQKGVVVLTKGTSLPEGTEVRIEPISPSPASDGDQPDFVKEALEIAKSMEGLPSDLARNHDHYLHGLPKR